MRADIISHWYVNDGGVGGVDLGKGEDYSIVQGPSAACDDSNRSLVSLAT